MNITLSNVPSEFDRALRSAVAGDVIVLAPGQSYTCSGGWSGEDGILNVASGVKIVATGAMIQLVAPLGLVRKDHDLPMLRCGAGVEIEGGTWDCNYADCTSWFTMGFRFHGRFTVRGATIIGMSGSRRAGVEAFAISSEGDTGGSVVENVTVQARKADDPDDYVSGIYVGATAPCASESSVINCSVDLGDVGQFAYSSNGPTRFVNCFGRAARFWYNDTGDTHKARIIDCTGRAVYAIVSCVAKDQHGLREVSVQGGQFDGGQEGRLVEWWEDKRTNPLARISGGVSVHGVKWNGRYLAGIDAPRGALAITGCTFPDNATVALVDGSVQPLVV